MRESRHLCRDEGYGACDDVGHAENEYNNRCDELAVKESKKFKDQIRRPAAKHSAAGLFAWREGSNRGCFNGWKTRPQTLKS